jgi:dihydroorotase-like cyclic amidohydrolase
LVRELMPPVCKLYSYGDGFWENLDAVFDADLLPIIYCKNFEDVQQVVERARGPVHFRHAVSEALIKTMRQLPGATLQTSPHFLLPLDPAQRHQLVVLPPVPEDDVRQGLLDRFLDEIDLVVTDHNGPPLSAPTGPGLQVAQDFLAALVTACGLYGWPLDRVWAKATAAPAARYGVDLGDTFVVVDPHASRQVGLWPPRQTVERAPYLGTRLAGRVLAIGADDAATLV